MRILFLTHYFPPEVNAPASRTFEHCREWVRDGDEVTVVTCAPNHPSGKIYPGYRNRLWQREVIAGIQVIRIWTFVAANQGVVRRSLNYLSYLLSVMVAAPLLPRADVVVSTSPQFFCGLAGYFVSRLKRAEWVLEIRDLWPESIIAVGALRQQSLIRLLERLERWAYRKADRIVAVTDGIARQIRACGVPADKVAVIKNGVDLAMFSLPCKASSLRPELGLEGKFVVAYFGTLGMAHRLETALEAADMLRDEAHIAFLIVGHGAERARLERLVRTNGLNNVLLLEQRAKERMPALWASCDASLILLRKSPLFLSAIPSKLFEAMAMARPIILGLEGESRTIIETTGCGVPVEPENARELADAVQRLARDPALARGMGERGRRFVAECYNRAKLAAEFRAMMQGTLAGRA